jgi:hypothetical protein
VWVVWRLLYYDEYSLCAIRRRLSKIEVRGRRERGERARRERGD